MMLQLDVQRKAQAEIDRVVGEDRLPTFGDRPNLPYIEALVLELIRFHSVIPGGGYIRYILLSLIRLTFNLRWPKKGCEGRHSEWVSSPRVL